MQTTNYWKQFEHTGKVEDYLSYVAGEPSAKPENAVTSETGVNPYAGIHMGNGNDIETDAYRGIR